MNKNNAPVFRKSMNGFNKEDVTSYIINMSKRYSETEASFKYEIDRLNYELTTKSKSYEQASIDYEKALTEKDTQLKALSDEIACLKSALAEKNTEIDALLENIQTSANKNKADNPYASTIAENDKAILFDSISSKTGEIMILACKTADDIIAKAQKEADDIINSANSKKNNMLRSISGSAESITSDINAYIKNAVNNCIDKIYSSIESIDSKEK